MFAFDSSEILSIAVQIKKTTTNLREKKNPEWKDSIRNKFQTLPMSVPICLNMYFFFIYALLKNNNTLVHIAHTTHNTARQCFKQPNEKEMGKQTKKQFEFIAIVQKLHPTGH